MTNDPFTPIRQRLEIILNLSPDTLVPILTKKIVSACSWILPEMSVNAIEETIVDLTLIQEIATKYGREDISDELEWIKDALYDELPEETERPCRAVSEVYIDFGGGKGTISCEGCNAADVADALITIAEALRTMDETPDYIGFDEGKISVGQAGRYDHAS